MMREHGNFNEAFTIYMKFDEDEMFNYFEKTLDKAFFNK